MLIYNYDPITKEYMSSEEALKNPLAENEPIVPANATTIKPIDKRQGFAIIWVGNKWEYEEDHRNEVWYNSNAETQETITFLGALPNNYYPLDSTRANKPDGPYWVYDSDNNIWVADILLYKQYILAEFGVYWNIKQNTPFEFEGFRYIPLWRDLYDSIYNTLSNGIKSTYRLQDFDSKYNTVDKKTMKPIYAKMADIVDAMYIDKQDLEKFFKQENDFDALQKAFEDWVNKIYQ